MADPLREALAALVAEWKEERWASRREPRPDLTPEELGRLVGRHEAEEEVRALLAAHPEPAEPPAPEGAVRVRIAVAVDEEGGWWATGAIGYVPGQWDAAREARSMVGVPARLSWVEAWVPRPDAEQVVEGRLEPEDRS